MIKNKKCGEEMKGKQLSEFKKIFEKIKLPETFINTFLKVYMGNGLKCWVNGREKNNTIDLLFTWFPDRSDEFFWTDEKDLDRRFE